jgi:hypothetical protein
MPARSSASNQPAFGAFDAGLAGGHAQLEDAAGGEKRARITGKGKLAPLEAGIHGEHVALGVAVGAGPRADAVGSLEAEQRLVAEHGVERLELAGEVLLQLLGRNAHLFSRRGAEPPRNSIRNHLFGISLP